jgi:hypothetical protein
MGGDTGTTSSLDDRTLKVFSRSTEYTHAGVSSRPPDVSRMISGKLRLDMAPMDMGGVINAAVETILPLPVPRTSASMWQSTRQVGR